MQVIRNGKIEVFNVEGNYKKLDIQETKEIWAFKM